VTLRPKPAHQRDEWHRNPHRRTNARKALGRATTWPTTCPGCGRTLNPFDDWHLGHIKDRATHPELMWDPNNHRVECADCNRKAGGRLGRAIQLGQVSTPPRPGGGRSLEAAPAKQAPDPPRVIPPQTPEKAPVSHGTPLPGPEPQWEPESAQIADLDWLADLADVPDDAALPRAMSAPHPDAAGSLGAEFEAWVLERTGVRLRWWQRLAARMQLQVNSAGELLIREVAESTPRRAGKSVRLRSMALWRIGQEDRFGEQQLVLHTGKDLPICKEIHRRAWPLAESWGWSVRRQNGNEEIETGQGSRWMVRGRDSVYGYDVTLGMVDESWGVPPVVVDEGLEPALLERVQPQLVLTSTAHRRATPLMVDRLNGALAGLGVDCSTLLLLWGAGRDAPVDDPRVWRAAAPHWSEQRARMCADRVARALRGESSPDDDDLDPVEAFRAQYLNVWPDLAAPRSEGVPLLEVGELDRWARPGVAAQPAAVAVDSWFGDGFAVAFGWRVDGGLLVGVRRAASIVDAAGMVRAAGGGPRVLVGRQHSEDAVWSGLGVEPLRVSGRVAAFGLRAAFRAGGLWHDGGGLLSGQLEGLMVARVDGVDGPRLLPGGRTDAVRAVFGVVQAAAAPDVGAPGWFSAGGGRA